MTRDEADLLALHFLRDNGPHTMGPIEDDSAFAAALIFLDLKKAGLVAWTKIAPGYVQIALTDAGVRAAA